jgi:hypothetical protein
MFKRTLWFFAKFIFLSTLALLFLGASFSKGSIEGALEGALKKMSSKAPTKHTFPTPVIAMSKNASAIPGKVHWHVDMKAACAASQKSKKPVLLFQMMGRLDQEFC